MSTNNVSSSFAYAYDEYKIDKFRMQTFFE